MTDCVKRETIRTIITSTPPQTSYQVHEKLSTAHFLVSGIQRAKITDPKPEELLLVYKVPLAYSSSILS